jgi:hypothetical protein
VVRGGGRRSRHGWVVTDVGVGGQVTEWVCMVIRGVRVFFCFRLFLVAVVSALNAHGLCVPLG